MTNTTTPETLRQLKAEIRALEALRGGDRILPLRRLFNARLRAGEDRDDYEWHHVSYDACPGADTLESSSVYGTGFD